jgi:hypothetical protein
MYTKSSGVLFRSLAAALLLAGLAALAWPAAAADGGAIVLVDHVWLDANQDGIRGQSPLFGSDEAPLQGVLVDLYTCDGAPVDSEATNNNGNTSFTQLAAGDYFVEFVRPAGYAFTLQDVPAGGENNDSDADPLTGRTACFTLAPGQTKGWDAGLIEETPPPQKDLVVKKTAAGSYTRQWHWAIDKTGSAEAITLQSGQAQLVNYDVTVSTTGSTDSGFAVAGGIFIQNPNAQAVQINGVSDVLSDGTAGSVDCGVAFPHELAGGATLECAYTAAPGSAAATSNTATVASALGEFSGGADVAWTVTELDECVDVTDSFAGFLGTVCAGAAPQTFSYARTVGPYTAKECGQHVIGNTVSFAANDTGATGSDSWNVTVTVPCAAGCTLTPGYWKTHSEFGPAPYDDTWAQLPNGASTTFFLSGASHHTVLWTTPRGNAYYILAHAYIAAGLNFLNGADPSAAQAAFDQATALFQAYTPAQIGALRGNSALRQQFISLAGTLDAYNNGYIGPGHCN